MHNPSDVHANLLTAPIKSTFKDRIFRIKPMQHLPIKIDKSFNLKKSLNLLSLLLFGIGNSLGVGVFALLGIAS